MIKCVFLCTNIYNLKYTVFTSPIQNETHNFESISDHFTLFYLILCLTWPFYFFWKITENHRQEKSDGEFGS